MVTEQITTTTTMLPPASWILLFFNIMASLYVGPQI